jgi:nicotinic acetylcholine receptor
MAFLSMMVFYLPAEADEKITLAISILLALVVFLLLVSKILPPTSSTIPLMAKYLLTTFCLNIVAILVTVVIINIFFRGPTTHRMPRWVKSLFLRYLPLFLMMRRPEPYRSQNYARKQHAKMCRRNGEPRRYPVGEFIEMSQIHHHPRCHQKQPRATDFSDKVNSLLNNEAIQAIEAVDYITAHLKRLNKYKKVILLVS